MVRSYKKTKAVHYSNEDLDAAVALLRNDKSMSFRQAARYLGIPTKTLHDHCKGIRSQVGAAKPTILSRDEEREIAVNCMVLQELGFGLTKDILFLVVGQYISDNRIPNPFKNGIPGESWWYSFMKRWPILSERKPEHLTKSRARSLTYRVIQEWTKKLSAVYESAHLNDEDPRPQPNEYGTVTKQRLQQKRLHLQPPLFQ